MKTFKKHIAFIPAKSFLFVYLQNRTKHPYGCILLTLISLFVSGITAQSGYLGVWQPGSGAQWWHSGLSWLEFKTKDATYFSQGLRLEDVEISDGKYTAVWRPGNGTQWWHSDLSWLEFKTKDATYFSQDLRLKDVEIVNGKYFAVWQPGSGAQFWKSGMTFDQFKTQDQTYFSSGLRIEDFEFFNGYYFAVWRAGNGAQYWKAGMTFDQFTSQDKTYRDQGLRLKDVEIVGGKYMAVWQPGNGTQWYWSGICQDVFKSEDKIYFDQGLRLVDLELISSASAIFRLPFDDDFSWKMGQGNWDDPVAGHNQGDANGNQAYAFDFLHPIGGNVRAARSGKVIFVENHAGNNLDTKAPNYDANAVGYGTAILIRHSDNTVAAYDHLKFNSPNVVLGQSVSRGQIIALSGHTGSSTQPHLHMDVHSFWNSANDCGPTIRIHFDDKNHSCWIPRVGDNLASNNN